MLPALMPSEQRGGCVLFFCHAITPASYDGGRALATNRYPETGERGYHLPKVEAGHFREKYFDDVRHVIFQKMLSV